MDKEMVEVRDSVIIAAEIRMIKRQTMNAVLSASVEIGKRLCEAKELVPHGDWESWLHDKVDYSQSTANNLMKIYKEYGDEQINLFSETSKSQTFGNLSYSQAVALFALPADEREEFVKENDMQDMSVRDIQEAIKAKEEAERRAQQAEQQLQKSEESKKQAEKTAAQTDKKLNADIKRLQKEIEVAKKQTEPDPAQVEQVKAELRAEIEAKYEEQLKQLSLDKQSSEDTKEQIEREYKQKLERIQQDNKNLTDREKELQKKLAIAGSTEAQRFGILFESFQEDFNRMSGCLTKLDKDGTQEIAAKFKGALKTVLAGMAQKMEG